MPTNATSGMYDLMNRMEDTKSVYKAAQHSTNKKAGSELDMTDFLTLMVAMFQNQDMENTASTTDMMNQMVQMQMVSAITTLNETSIQTYANSLVGQDVTVGIVNGDKLEERVIQVMGTGTFNGQQVIFGSDGNMYYLNQIMAVGVLPDENGKYPQFQGDEETPDVNVDPDLIPEFGRGPDPGESGDDVTPPEGSGDGGGE